MTAVAPPLLRFEGISKRFGSTQAVDDLTFALDRNVRLYFADPDKVEVQIATVGEGHFRFVLATRKDSPIRNIADLKAQIASVVRGADELTKRLARWRLKQELNAPPREAPKAAAKPAS